MCPVGIDPKIAKEMNHQRAVPTHLGRLFLMAQADLVVVVAAFGMDPKRQKVMEHWIVVPTLRSSRQFLKA